MTDLSGPHDPDADYSGVDPDVAVRLTLLQAEYLRVTTSAGVLPAGSDFEFLTGVHRRVDPTMFARAPIGSAER